MTDERRTYALSAERAHLVITWNDGEIERVPRGTLVARVDPGVDEMVYVGEHHLRWRNETALGATSRADLLDRLRAAMQKLPMFHDPLDVPINGRTVRKHFHNSSVLTSVWESGDANGGAPLLRLTSETVSAEVFDANDTAAGSGLRSITAYGLDDDFNEISETLTTDGAGPGPVSTQSFRRVNSAVATTAGTALGANYSSVYVYGNTSGSRTDVWFGWYWQGATTPSANMGVGQAAGGHYTVPAGHAAYISRFAVHRTSGSNSIKFGIWTHAATSSVEPMVLQWYHEASADEAEHKLSVPIRVPEKTDILIRLYSVGTTELRGNLDLILVPE